MSNHLGSHLLNDVLFLMEKRGILKQIGKGASQELVIEILELSRGYDCNSGEILDEIGERLEICSRCLKAKAGLVKRVCAACRQQ